MFDDERLAARHSDRRRTVSEVSVEEVRGDAAHAGWTSSTMTCRCSSWASATRTSTSVASSPKATDADYQEFDRRGPRGRHRSPQRLLLTRDNARRPSTRSRAVGVNIGVHRRTRPRADVPPAPRRDGRTTTDERGVRCIIRSPIRTPGRQGLLRRHAAPASSPGQPWRRHRRSESSRPQWWRSSP